MRFLKRLKSAYNLVFHPTRYANRYNLPPHLAEEFKNYSVVKSVDKADIWENHEASTEGFKYMIVSLPDCCIYRTGDIGVCESILKS